MRVTLRNYLLKAAVASIFLGASSYTYASGFQLFEQNGAGVGDYDSGAAAEAQDASIAWYNPAGLVMIDHQQLVLSAVGIDISSEFQGEVQNYELVNTPGGHGTINQETILGSDEYGKAQGGGFSTVPSFHYALPINNDIVAAISLVVPFGLETDWPKDSVLRYSATETSIEDIDITPSVGIKITPKFSIGAGIDFENVDAIFDQVVGLGNLEPYDSDSYSTNEANQWALGWHGGILYQFTPHTRVGFAYHSRVTIDPDDGTSTLKGPLVTDATDGATDTYKTNNLSSDVTLPGYATLSIFHDINDRWAVKGSVNYTEWSVFDNIALNNVAGVEQSGLTGFQTTELNVNVPQNFHNTWRISAGLNFKQTDRWMWRAGVGVDQDPTNDTDRNVRLPDADVFAIAFGAHFQASKAVSFDAGYQHLFTQDAEINNTGVVGAQTTYVNGTVDNAVDLFSLQMNWNIT